MKHNYNEMLSKIAETISKFLKEQGGLSNGYDTFIDSSIKYNSHQFIVFHTPQTDKLTGNELKKISSDLNDKLIKILNKYKYEDVVKIASIHTQHGCYDIEVSFKTSVKVSLINCN
jgi:hypothetical protein